jgi:hypothetical protein
VRAAGTGPPPAHHLSSPRSAASASAFVRWIVSGGCSGGE